MLITAVESSVVSMPFTMGGPHSSFAGQRWDRMEILLVRVETADGLVGWGEAFGHAAIASTRAALDTIVAPLVLGPGLGRYRRADPPRAARGAPAGAERALRLCLLRHRDRALGHHGQALRPAGLAAAGRRRAGEPAGLCQPALLWRRPRPGRAQHRRCGGPGLPPHQAARADPRRGAGRAIRRTRGAHHARRELRLDPAGRPRHGANRWPPTGCSGWRSRSGRRRMRPASPACAATASRSRPGRTPPGCSASRR